MAFVSFQTRLQALKAKNDLQVSCWCYFMLIKCHGALKMQEGSELADVVFLDLNVNSTK